MSVTEILMKYSKGEYTKEEANEALKEIGSDIVLTDGMKTGNAVLVMGETNIEIVTVEDGKLVNGAGCGSSDYVIYMGEIYHTENGDNYTLVKGKPAPCPDSPNKLPATPDKSRRKDLAGKTVTQKTATGDFAVTYDENGYAIKTQRV